MKVTPESSLDVSLSKNMKKFFCQRELDTALLQDVFDSILLVAPAIFPISSGPMPLIRYSCIPWIGTSIACLRNYLASCIMAETRGHPSNQQDR